MSVGKCDATWLPNKQCNRFLCVPLRKCDFRFVTKHIRRNDFPDSKSRKSRAKRTFLCAHADNQTANPTSIYYYGLFRFAEVGIWRWTQICELTKSNKAEEKSVTRCQWTNVKLVCYCVFRMMAVSIRNECLYWANSAESGGGAAIVVCFANATKYSLIRVRSGSAFDWANLFAVEFEWICWRFDYVLVKSGPINRLKKFENAHRRWLARHSETRSVATPNAIRILRKYVRQWMCVCVCECVSLSLALHIEQKYRCLYPYCVYISVELNKFTSTRNAKYLLQIAPEQNITTTVLF